MNILILTNIYPYEKDDNPDRTKIVAYFAREWVKQGHNVCVVINSAAFPGFYYGLGKYISKEILKHTRLVRLPDPIWTKEFEYNDFGVKVINLPMRKYVPQGTYSKKILQEQYKKIEYWISQLDFYPDVITGHWLNPQLFLVAKFAAKYKAKTAFVFHSDFYKEKYKKFKVQRFIESVDHIGFRSRSALNYAMNYMKLKNEPFVCSSGIPDEYLERFIYNEEKIFHNESISVITAGRLVQYKHIDTIIDAAQSAFCDGKYRVNIAGDGPLKKELNAYIRDHNLDHNVVMYGQIDRDQLQALMRSSDVFALISEREVFGLVYLEAMLHGCIVIASRFGAIDGIIIDGENGFLCEEGNGEELKKILLQIKSMPNELKSTISNKAIATARQYSESIVASNYLQEILK